jgi:hypothetical protein
MRYLAVLLCLFTGCCVSDEGRASSMPAASASALTPSECDRLVRRAYANLLFSKTSTPYSASEPGLVSGLMASCKAGGSSFNRSYFNCVFASKYSDTMDCAYVARGIDRAKSNPLLANLKAGDDGAFQSSIKEMVAAVYKGQDPHKSIDRITLDLYLDKRDNVDRSLGETPPADHSKPLRTSSSSVPSNGQTYWVVREDFTDLQLVKVMHEDAAGADTVVCAHYGSSARLKIDSGYCGALIKTYLHTNLVD